MWIEFGGAYYNVDTAQSISRTDEGRVRVTWPNNQSIEIRAGSKGHATKIINGIIANEKPDEKG